MRVTVWWMAAVVAGLVAYGGQALSEHALQGYENGSYLLCGENGGLPPGETENERVGPFTVAELGAVIEASGRFWAEWWGIDGRFGWEHLGDWDDVPEWLQGGHIAVLPSSGFESLDDIRDYLLQYHTVRWVDDHLTHYTFVEYDGVLYMDGVRYSAGDMCWEAATHVMMEQRGARAVVESTATLWSWDWDYDAEGVVRVSDEVVRRFTLINGRIGAAMPCPSCRGWWC
jgi:hypothetical protein